MRRETETIIDGARLCLSRRPVRIEFAWLPQMACEQGDYQNGRGHDGAHLYCATCGLRSVSLLPRVQDNRWVSNCI